MHIIYMVLLIPLRVRDEISPPNWSGGMMRNFAREGIFYQLMGIRGLISTIPTFFKAKSNIL